MFSDDEEDEYKQVTEDNDEYNTTEYVAITEYEDNTKYDHNNTVKSVAMF